MWAYLMFNPKKIEKHTCLFALHEPELSKLAAKEVEDKKAQAKTASIALEEVNKKKAADKVEKKKQGKHDDKWDGLICFYPFRTLDSEFA